MRMYVVAGPQKIGNIFGYFGYEVPEGKLAVVVNGEYANGGFGPSQAFKGLFSSEEEAKEAMKAHIAKYGE